MAENTRPLKTELSLDQMLDELKKLKKKDLRKPVKKNANDLSRDPSPVSAKNSMCGFGY